MACVQNAKVSRARFSFPNLERLESRLAPAASLLKDINLTTADSQSLYGASGNLATLGETLYFAADDGVHGVELWASDGVTTRLVKDIRDGAASANPTHLTGAGGVLYFLVDQGDFLHRQVWRTDGTEMGTWLLKDYSEGDTSFDSRRPYDLTEVNGSLFLSIWDWYRSSLWTSDGTGAGTVRLSVAQSSSSIGKPFGFDGATYFVKSVPSGESSLWKTDGTEAGTVEVPGVPAPTEYVTYKGRLYFTANSAAAGNELYSSDGTAAGTFLLKDINTKQRPLTRGTNDSNPAHFQVANGLLYFTADDGIHGAEVWCTDGTREGTRQVRDISPTSSFPESLTEFGGQLYFVATDVLHGTELWKSDGTEAGTAIVSDLNTVPNSWDNTPPGSYPRDLVVAGDYLYLVATDGVHGTQMFRVGKETSEVVRVTDFDSWLFRIPVLWPAVEEPSSQAVGDSLFFFANDGLHGNELWKATGSEVGATLVSDINQATIDSNPTWITQVGNTTYFVADDGVHGRELWRTDGTAGGTRLVVELSPGRSSSGLRDLIAVGDKLYFVADIDGPYLYQSDGTAAGTKPVGRINDSEFGANAPYYTEVTNLTVFKGQLYYSMTRNTTTGLYRFDPVTELAVRLGRFVTRFNTGQPAVSELTETNGILFFSANVAASGAELWRTDGTAKGTRLIRDISTGRRGSVPHQLTAFGKLLLFKADNGPTGVELWKSDGTVSGTRLVKNINRGANHAFSVPRPYVPDDESLVVVGGYAYFSADDGAHGAELWRSNGTAFGTTLVKDIYAGKKVRYPEGRPVSNSSWVTNLTAVNGTLLFRATTDQGDELWKSDGTVSGTSLIKDIYPGTSGAGDPNGSLPDDFVVMSGALYFTANDGEHGRELWVSDGTPDGTRIAQDINPGALSGVGWNLWGFPAERYLHAAGGKLYILGSDFEHGAELWVYAPAAPWPAARQR